MTTAATDRRTSAAHPWPSVPSSVHRLRDAAKAKIRQKVSWSAQEDLGRQVSLCTIGRIRDLDRRRRPSFERRSTRSAPPHLDRSTKKDGLAASMLIRAHLNVVHSVTHEPGIAVGVSKILGESIRSSRHLGQHVRYTDTDNGRRAKQCLAKRQASPYRR